MRSGLDRRLLFVVTPKGISDRHHEEKKKISERGTPGEKRKTAEEFECRGSTLALGKKNQTKDQTK